MRIISLLPLDGRESFYGKCTLIEEADLLQLKSYETIVATYVPSMDLLHIEGYYSRTTQRHLNAFLDHIGKPSMSKQDVLSFIKTQDAILTQPIM